MPRIAFLSCLLSTCLTLGTAAPAQERKAPGETYLKRIEGVWTVECRVPVADESPCRLSTLVNDPPILLVLSVDALDGAPAAIALALVDEEFGPPEVRLGVDDFPIEGIAAEGMIAVYAGAPARRLVTQFTYGVRARIGFEVARTSQRIVLFVPLAGFGRALDTYRAQQILRDQPGWAKSGAGG